MANQEHFPVVDCDSEVRGLVGAATTLQAAVEVVERLDRRDGRGRYEPAHVEIVQVAAPRGGRPRFFVHLATGREGRPRGNGQNPLRVENVRASGQHYLVIRTPQHDLVVLFNPYGYADQCVTWATNPALSQQCGDRDGHTRWSTAFALALFLCTQLNGHVVGFNEKCGNSLDDLHWVSHLPPLGFGPYPVQMAFASQRHSPVAHIGGDDYPTHVWRFALGSDTATAEAATVLMNAWCGVAGSFASANIAAVRESGRTVLYVTPRDRRLRAVGWKSPAFLELLGLFIASADEFAQVRNGEMGFDQIWAALSSLKISDAAAAEINEHLGAMTF